MTGPPDKFFSYLFNIFVPFGKILPKGANLSNTLF